LVAAKEAGASLEGVIEQVCGWEAFSRHVDNALLVDAKVSADPLDFVNSGYHRFRRYAPRLLGILEMEGARSAEPLLSAIRVLRKLNDSGKRGLPSNVPIAFARPKWRKRLQQADRRTWETAVLFSLRDAFRAGDVWLRDSRRYAQPTTELMPVQEVGLSPSLAVPLDAAEWIEQRKRLLAEAFQVTGEAARRNALPNGLVSDGVLQLSKLERQTPDDADRLVLDLYGQIPMTRITDVLLQADDDIGFSEAFTDLRTGVPCRDRIGLLTVLLSNGVNLGLHKMADATNRYTFWELLRIARWHVEEDAYQQALAMVVEAQSQLPMAQLWGSGISASADGQFFPAAGHGEAMNLVNLKYGTDPGVKAYTHVSDQFAPFATQAIPATAHEAPYILDGLLLNEAGRRVKEQYSDTGGFTDHVFAMCSILGYSFAPRIRDLPAKRLYAFDLDTVHDTLRPLVAARINEDLITRNWPDVLRLSASAAANWVKPSQVLKRLSAYPRQNELAMALREIGRVERSLFIMRWILDTDLQHRVQMGLNKGEAHHALKRAISFNRRGEIRDRSTEGQHFRIAGMNLIAAIVIYWNTKQLGEVVQRLIQAGTPPDPTLLPHVSPLGWEHINLTGEYHWPEA
jgi:TnpA family transposase